MATIEIRRLTKRFDELVAVDAIDLDVAAGEVVCLLGPSGCGKTTTLRMIAGLESATGGDIRLAGERVNERPARERDVAMVFQFYALYPSLTVAENLEFALHAERIGRTERARRVREVAAKLQLGPFLHRRPHHLAEGEKQRVAVGRAIVRDPACFLFDEPLSRLDVQLRETMRGQIKEVLAGLNKATVIVTHDQLEALSMADRIAVMRDGVIEQVASPHGIFQEPANLFVAGFIGTPSMNFVPATLIGPDHVGTRFRTGTQEVTLPADPATAELAPGTDLTIGIRPRSFELVPEPARDTLEATVDLIEPMGAETLLHLMEDGQDLRAVVPRRIRASHGERVHVRCRPGQVHVFDAEGRRIHALEETANSPSRLTA
jgi:multiple sugar transport system ATP-binding protein